MGMYLSKEQSSKIDRIKNKILKSVIGENCDDVYYAISELDDIHNWTTKAIIIEQKNPAE